jgi:hypothetical protein
MSVLDSLRKGFNLFLLSMGVSAPVKKPRTDTGVKPPDGK